MKKTLKNLFPLVAICLMLTSCVTFDQPMPRSSRTLSEFPANLQGSYESDDEEGKLMVVDANSVSINDETFTIGTEIVLKPYMGYKIVNILQEDGSYMVYAVEAKAGQPIKLGILDLDEEGKKEIFKSIANAEAIAVIDQPNSVSDGSVISLTDREFQKLLKQGAFTFEELKKVK